MRAPNRRKSRLRVTLALDAKETMNDLKAEYSHIEEDITWPEKPKGIGGKQFYLLITDLSEKVRERSLAENLDPLLYGDRLYKLLDFASNLRGSLTDHWTFFEPEEKKYEQLIWYHRDNHQLKKDDEPKISRESLLETIVTYLTNPWLQHDRVDWIFIDSLIFAEISAYKESIFTGQALGKVNWSYAFTGGDTNKILLFQVTKALALFTLRYLLPPAILFLLYYFHRESAFLIVGAVYAVYLLVHAALWPLRYRKRKTEQKILQEHLDRLQKMIDAYYYCKPPILSLSTLRTYLNKAAEGRAIFDGALFSILKRVEENRGDTFMPFVKQRTSKRY